jgi:hypothetical protein
MEKMSEQELLEAERVESEKAGNAEAKRRENIRLISEAQYARTNVENLRNYRLAKFPKPHIAPPLPPIPSAEEWLALAENSELTMLRKKQILSRILEFWSRPHL